MVSVLITGASRGLGFEFAREYALDGARVFTCCRTPNNAAQAQSLAAQYPNVTLHALDIADPGSVTSLANALKNETIDILVNNAGIGADIRNPVFDYAVWEESFRVNTIAPFRMAQSFRPLMTNGEKKIVTLSSGRASHARMRGEDYAYVASKAALNSAMHNLSVAWAGDDFTIVLFGPGSVKTDMNPEGQLTPAQSVGGMRNVIEALTKADNGRYIDWQGKDIPW